MTDKTEDRAGVVALKWWASLTDSQHGDRGALAQLRRCEQAIEALTIPAAIVLARRLAHCNLDERFTDALGLAIVLAHVKEHDPQRSLMRAAGWSSFPGDRKNLGSGTERPVLSELRFRRLLQTTREDRIPAFVRLVRMLGAKVNIVDLAESFLFWGDKRRQKWAFDYFAAGASAPISTETGVQP
jgi:CRISPR system Cascade subunit CasB